MARKMLLIQTHIDNARIGKEARHSAHEIPQNLNSVGFGNLLVGLLPARSNQLGAMDFFPFGQTGPLLYFRPKSGDAR